MTPPSPSGSASPSLTAMLNGWVLIEDQLLEIAGLSPDDRDHARETLVACMRTVLAPVAGGT